MSDPAGDPGLLAALDDIRLPAEASGGAGAEVLAALALAFGLALALAAGLRLLTRPARAAAAPSLAQQVQAAIALPDPQARRALLDLLRQHRPQDFAALAADLYDPARAPQTAALADRVLGR